MRMDDLSAPSGRFVTRVSAPVATVDRCPGRERALPAANNGCASVFAVPTEVGTGSTEAPAAATAQGTDSVETTGPTASAPASPGPPEPRRGSRLRTASPPGLIGVQQQQMVLHPLLPTMAFGPGGAPRPYARRANTPLRVPRPRPAPPTAATPAPAASAVPTVSIPSDRGRAEPVGTLLLRLTPPLGDTSPAPAKVDALDDAAELQFNDSVARYSHADWAREQQAEPTCHAAMRFITIGRPSALPTDFFVVLPFAQASFLFGHPGTGW